MTDTTLLRPGDQLPTLSVARAGGGILHLPDDLVGHFGVILLYRGSWCPYCNAQLSAFQRSLDRLADIGAQVAAMSVDDEATTQDLIARHGLRFPVGHSADAQAIAATTGAFINDDPVYFQSTGFVLDPDGSVVVSVYSSGAIGRLVPGDVIGLIHYLRQHTEASNPS
jgi:peroxiredoxin